MLLIDLIICALSVCVVAAIAYCLGMETGHKRAEVEAALERAWSERNYRAGYLAGIAETQRGRDAKGTIHHHERENGMNKTQALAWLEGYFAGINAAPGAWLALGVLKRGEDEAVPVIAPPVDRSPGFLDRGRPAPVRHETPANPPLVTTETAETGPVQAQGDDAGPREDTPDPLPPVTEKKPRKPWTEAQREAQRQRLNARIAAGTFVPAKGGRKPAEPKPRQDTPADQLIDQHREYAGEREDKTLVDADWGDIRTMKRNGLPMERIARSKGVELDYLVRFVARQEDRETAGNV